MQLVRSLKQSLILLCAVVLFVTLGCRASDSPSDLGNVTAKLPQTTNSLGVALVHIPAGRFLMGSKHGDFNGPVHKVILSSFWISQYDVTNTQFEAFHKRGRPPESLGDRQPVTRIGYPEAVDFCRWLSKKEQKHYRLPTEAEWEYAARGGLVQKDYPWGNEDPQGRATVTIPFSASLNTVTTPVGAHAPNGYGLYDMAGNVSNWTSDWFDEAYFSHGPIHNPKGPAHPLKALQGIDNSKVVRGGSFNVGDCYVWLRDPVPIDLVPDLTKMSSQDQQDGSGFRIVLDEEAAPKRLNFPVTL